MRPIDYFLRSASLSTNDVFLKDYKTEYSYKSAEIKIRLIAQALQARGLKQDDSVAVYSPNNADAVICIFGAILAGASWVPVNIRNSVKSNIDYMKYVSTKWLFFDSSLETEIDSYEDKLTFLNQSICIDKNIEKHSSVEDFIRTSADYHINDPTDPFSSPDSVFSRWPTGGTTGPSKGVEMKNSNIVTMFELGIKHYIGTRERDIVHLAVAPITHAAGLLIGIFSACKGLNIIHENFNAIQVLQEIEKAVTCVQFGQERLHKAYILLATGVDSSRARRTPGAATGIDDERNLEFLCGVTGLAIRCAIVPDRRSEQVVS